MTFPSLPQQEARAERQEARLHAKATHAALHGRIGKALVLEVCVCVCVCVVTACVCTHRHWVDHMLSLHMFTECFVSASLAC